MHRRAAIDDLLAGELSTAGERRVRRHIAGCARCRDEYDRRLRLWRALVGDAACATGRENAHVVRRALAGAGIAPSAPARPTLPDRIIDAPARFAMAAAAVLLLILGGTIWLASSRHGTDASVLAAAQLTTARGVRVDGRAVADGAVVPPGARVEVAASGVAVAELARGGRVRLYPGAKLALAERGVAVDLAEGKVWCEVDRNRGTFSVRTASAEARVVGTSFVVDRGERGDTDVRVMSGTVEVEDAQHRGTVRVQGGQRTHVGNGAPERVRRYSSDSDRQEWTRIFEQIGQAIERAFKELTK